MKKVIIIGLLACCVSSLFAQGSGEGKETATSQVAAGVPVTVTFWTGDRHDLDYVQKKIDEFNKTNNQNITVEMTVVSDKLANMLQMAYSAGTAPDFFSISANSGGWNLKAFADARMLLPVNDYIKDPEYEKVTGASGLIVEGITAINGKVYWIPSAVRSGARMIYNKNLVEAAGWTNLPKTVDDLVKLSKDMTDAGQGKFYGVGFVKSPWFPRWMEAMCQRSGIYYYDYKRGVFDFSGYSEILKKFQEISKNQTFFPGSQTQGVDAMRAQFVAGNFGIWANGSQEAGVFTQQFPITDFEWIVDEIPSLDGKTHGSVTAPYQKGYPIMSNCKHPDAAWEVIKYLQSEEFLKGYLENGYALPLSPYLQKTVDTSHTGRLADFALKEYEKTLPEVPSVDVSGQDFRTVLTAICFGQSDVDSSLSDLTKRYNDALDRDVKLGKIKRLVIKDFDPMKPGAGTIEYLDK